MSEEKERESARARANITSSSSSSSSSTTTKRNPTKSTDPGYYIVAIGISTNSVCVSRERSSCDAQHFKTCTHIYIYIYVCLSISLSVCPPARPSVRLVCHKIIYIDLRGCLCARRSDKANIRNITLAYPSTHPPYLSLSLSFSFLPPGSAIGHRSSHRFPLCSLMAIALALFSHGASDPHRREPYDCRRAAPTSSRAIAADGWEQKGLAAALEDVGAGDGAE